MFVALGIQHAKKDAPYFQLWPVRLCTIFLLYLINATILEIKNYLTEKGLFPGFLKIFI
jgi:hypothetical protein